jgi:glycosyltransferase involved in cell wall biosynthesis
MRILAFVHLYLPETRGGAEVMLHSILTELVSRGHEVWVGATKARDKGQVETVDGVHVVSGFPAEELLELGWDRVLSHLTEASRVTTWARSKGIHSTQIVHSDHSWIRLNLATKPDLVVYNTEWLSRSMSPFFKGPSLVLHPPVFPERFRTEPGDMVTLVNPLPEKGAEIFYDLADRLPDQDFLVVEGGYERERQVYIEKPNVMFQTNTKDMKNRVYRKTRILLMPSSYESYGMTAVEACVSGIPVVASPTPGLVESLHTAGFHVDLEDREEWYRIVKELLTSEDAWKEASDRAIERAARLSSREELDRCVEAIERGDDG